MTTAPSDARGRPSRLTVRRLALASLAVNIGIVVSGGAVRLTGSGLGCPTWPSCTPDSMVPTGEHGIHGLIEFGNRMFTFAVAAVVLATLVAAYRHRPVRPDWRLLAAALFAGIPAQAVLGGITVLTGLNPWTVMLHLLLSMVLVAVATVLYVRTGRAADLPTRPAVPPALYRLAVATSGVLAVVLHLGAIVTASGPHAGDAAAPRTGLSLETTSRLHADFVFLLVGMTVALLIALYALEVPARARRAAAVLLGAELAQGALGFVQYFLELPVVLVGLHLLGAALLVVSAVQLMMFLRTQDAARTVALPDRYAIRADVIRRRRKPLAEPTPRPR